MESQITTPALNDLYRTLDYGYTFADFQNGFDQTIDGHTPYGIKPFLSLRYDSIRSQIAGLISGTKASEIDKVDFEVYPNPSTDWLFIQPSSRLSSEKIIATIFGITGQSMGAYQWEASESVHSISISELPIGVYVLLLQTGWQEERFVFLKAD